MMSDLGRNSEPVGHLGHGGNGAPAPYFEAAAVEAADAARTTIGAAHGNGAAHAARSARSREGEWLELLDRVAAGDQPALALLYDGTQRLVFALVQRIVGANDVAEEVVLDVYMQVWRSAATFDRERGRVTTWLLTLARSRALDRRRVQTTRQARETSWTEALVADVPDRALLDDVVGAGERAKLVRNAIHALPDVQRRAIELAYFPGLSHTEIAERLGEPLGTVKTRIRLAMIKLKDLLEALEDHR